MPISDTVPGQWDVVVLPFPYADRLAEKRRPGVIVSKDVLIRERGIAWVAMVTSAANAGWECDIPISNTGESGLVSASVVRPWKLATVDIARIVRVAGRISPDEAKHLAKVLARTI